MHAYIIYNLIERIIIKAFDQTLRKLRIWPVKTQAVSQCVAGGVRVIWARSHFILPSEAMANDL